MCIPSLTSHRLLCILVPLLLSAPCFSQERGKFGYADRELLAMCEAREQGHSIPAKYWRQFDPLPYHPIENVLLLTQEFEVVVDGVFLNLPSTLNASAETLAPHEEIVGFEVARVYKGSAPERIAIELNSDMLSFSGGDISRYTKRMQIMEEFAETLAPFGDQHHRLYTAFFEGEITEHELRSEESRLIALQDSLVVAIEDKHLSHLSDEDRKAVYSEYVRILPKLPIHGENFHTRGGAIKARESYLLGMSAVDSETQVFRLDEDSVSVFWGEQRDDIIIAWDSPEQFRQRTTYFGNFDPHDDADCETLRQVVGLADEETPEHKARELLDQYEFVARGEFVDVPTPSRAELRALAGEDTQVRFEVHQSFKGHTIQSIDLQVNSDMLFVPGESRSRHDKRQAIMAQYISLMRPHRERKEEILRAVSAGALHEQALEDEQQRVYALEEQYGQETGLSDLMTTRQVSSWLGDTFYERGGVIEPFATYLIGVNKIAQGEEMYLLGELPESPSRIYWGSEQEEVLRALDALTR